MKRQIPFHDTKSFQAHVDGSGLELAALRPHRHFFRYPPPKPITPVKPNHPPGPLLVESAPNENTSLGGAANPAREHYVRLSVFQLRRIFNGAARSQ